MAEEEVQNEGGEGGDDRAALESRAKTMGWAPKDQWRGDPNEWIDADVFIERGESIMPILRANNRRLEEEVKTLRSQNIQTQQLLRETSSALEALKEANTEIARERARAKKSELASAVKEARDAGDVERETELQTELTEITTELRQADAEAREGTQRRRDDTNGRQLETKDFTQEPWFKEWNTDNPWFGQDQERTEYAAFAAQQVQRSNPNLRHREFLDEVGRRVEKVFGRTGEPTRQRRVEGGRSTGGDRTSGKSFADLPADAKKACDRQAARLVGKGKAFANIEAWRKNYVEKYFSE